MLEEQLSDGREWVFDTVAPGYCDLSLYFVYGWVINFKGMKDALSTEKFPKSRAVSDFIHMSINGPRLSRVTTQWIDRMAVFVKTRREALTSSIKKIDGNAAAKIIADSASLQTEVVGFDEIDAERLGLKLGDTVAVIPDDNGKPHHTLECEISCGCLFHN